MRRLAPQAWLRALLNPQNTLEIALFGHVTVQPDWRIPPRTLDEHLIYFVTRNTCVGRAAGRRIEVAGPALAWLQPGTPHRLAHPPGGRPIDVYHLRFRLRAGRSALALRQEPLVLPGGPALYNQIDALYDEYTAELPHGQVRQRALLAGLLALACRGLAGADPGRRTLTDGQRRRLADLVARRRRMDLTAADLADHVGLSHDYFTRLFRQTYGQAPRTWLVHQRVRLAAQRLIESPQTITQIAHELGYADLFQFSRQFKRIMGQPPREYRRRH